jgi:HSP20 family protein
MTGHLVPVQHARRALNATAPITIEAGQNELHISGQVIEKERTGVMRHRMRRTGQFSYRVALPSGTDPDKISASHNDGVLTVTVPRTEASRPRRIDII